VRRLEDILTGLIDFTQRRTVELESINPNEVIQYVLRINSERLTERGLRVEISLGEEVAEILVDRERFEQVVRNLLAYAVDTSAPNDVLRVETGISCLSLKAQQTGDLDSDAYFEMKIYHRGKVIPEEDLTRLFNPFVTTRDYGTGIGLTIAKKIIEDHKGSISVKSETEGTLFTIWLPLNRPVTSGSE
jgi:signal transduction histidine kinase